MVEDGERQLGIALHYNIAFPRQHYRADRSKEKEGARIAPSVASDDSASRHFD